MSTDVASAGSPRKTAGEPIADASAYPTASDASRAAFVLVIPLPFHEPPLYAVLIAVATASSGDAPL